MTATRLDILCGGRLHLEQPVAGYRFGIDSLLLASVAAGLPGEHVLDACAGCGVVGIASVLLNARRRELTLVELQPELHGCATRNLERADIGRVQHRALLGDIRTLEMPPADLVTLNPPFYRIGHGRVSPRPSIATARHQLNGTLPELVNALHSIVAAQGHLVVAIDPAQLTILDRACECHDLRPCRRIVVSAAPDRREHLAIVVYRRQMSAPCSVTRAFLCDIDGQPNHAVQSLTQGNWESPLPGQCRAS